MRSEDVLPVSVWATCRKRPGATSTVVSPVSRVTPQSHLGVLKHLDDFPWIRRSLLGLG